MGKNTPIAAIQGDIGWSIPITHQWIAITRQWCRISNMETHRLTKKVINWSKNITINKQRNWIHKCVVFYENNNLLDISSVNNIPNVHSVLESLKTTMNIIWKIKGQMSCTVKMHGEGLVIINSELIVYLKMNMVLRLML